MTGIGNLEYRVNDIATLRFRGGLNYWFYTGPFNLDNRIYLAQSIQAHFRTQELSGHLGITGKYNLETETDITQIRAGLSKAFNGWKGTMYLRSPLSRGVIFRVVYGFAINVEM